MEKTARKPSSDPVQEKLRAAKESWNKEVSTLIGDLIDLKRAMNGHPSRFSNNQKSRITEPFSFDPSTVLGVLASDFQEIAQKGSAIVEQQADYAKNRRRSKPKSFSPQTAPIDQNWEAKPDLAKQLSAAVDDFLLIAEGSNPISRTLSRLKGPWFFGEESEKRKRHYRLSLLKVSARIEDELKKFEATILGSSDESIFAASKLLEQIGRDLSFFISTLNNFKGLDANLLPVPTPEGEDQEPIISEGPTKNTSKKEKKLLKGKTIEEKEELDKFKQKVMQEIKDFKKHSFDFKDLSETLVKRMANVVDNLFGANHDNPPMELFKDVHEVYQEVLAALNEQNGNSNFASMSEILADIHKKERENETLETTAQNILNKWIGKAVHKINPFDKTSPLRLDVSKVSERIRKNIDRISDLLEKDLDSTSLDPILKEVKDDFSTLRSLMRPLDKTIENKIFDRKFMSMLEDNQLPDFGTNLDKKQRERLQRTLEQRKFRDLGRFFDQDVK